LGDAQDRALESGRLVSLKVRVVSSKKNSLESIGVIGNVVRNTLSFYLEVNTEAMYALNYAAMDQFVVGGRFRICDHGGEEALESLPRIAPLIFKSSV
jgi:RNase P/RNase MRP subunit p29